MFGPELGATPVLLRLRSTDQTAWCSRQALQDLGKTGFREPQRLRKQLSKIHPTIAIEGQFDRSHKSVALFSMAQEKKRILALRCRRSASGQTRSSPAYDYSTGCPLYHCPASPFEMGE